MGHDICHERDNRAARSRAVRRRRRSPSCYTWVDQHNTLGLGNDVPISTGNENDEVLALVDGKWMVLRVPYPPGSRGG
jgi:hypothetical protein